MRAKNSYTFPYYELPYQVQWVCSQPNWHPYKIANLKRFTVT